MTDENEAATFAWRIGHEAALRAHAVDRDWQRYMFDSAIKFAVEAVKAICLLTGGAVVVGLAFVGSIYGSEPALAKALVTPVFLMAVSAVSAAACAGLSYITQYFYACASTSTRHKWDHPYVDALPASKRYRIAGGVFHSFAVLLALASIAFIIWGGWLAWHILTR